MNNMRQNYGANLQFGNQNNTRNTAMQQIDNIIMGKLMFQNMPGGHVQRPVQSTPMLPIQQPVMQPLIQQNQYNQKPMTMGNFPLQQNNQMRPMMGMNNMNNSGMNMNNGMGMNNSGLGMNNGMGMNNNGMGMNNGMNMNNGNQGYYGNNGMMNGGGFGNGMNQGYGGNTGPMPDNPALRQLFNRDNNRGY